MSDNLPTISLETDHIKAQLIRDLAMGEGTQKSLADQYGVVPSAISMFKQRHWREIEEYRDSLPNKLDDLWVVDKAERIKSLQCDIELLDSQADTDSLKLKLAIMKTIEESLGQLPPRTSVNITKAVNYTVHGVDLDDLS